MPLTEQTAQPSPQVLLVGEKESKRLLEAYVKRSLSLNDGAQPSPWRERQIRKWVPTDEKNKRERRHSSDTSLHLSASNSEDYLGTDGALSESETGKKPQATTRNSEIKSKLWKKRSTLRRNDGSSASHKSDGKPKKWFLPTDKEKHEGKQPNKACKQESGNIREASPQPPLVDQLESSTEAKKPKESKKTKKSSLWKSFLGWFSKGNNDKQEEQDGANEKTEDVLLQPEPSPVLNSCLPFPEVFSNGDAVILRHRQSKKRRSQKKSSLKRRSREVGQEKTTGRPCTLDLTADTQDLTVKSIEEVEPTNSYYEKMSEELQKIVQEVKNSPVEDNRTFHDAVQPADINCTSILPYSALPVSQEEVIERIIALIKQQGDVIDCKLQENPTIISYFNMLSYGSFQKLADQYVQSEVPQQKSQPPVAAPELVKFAFTLDFTARVAGLSRHAPGHIVGFGNQYLKDRFTHTSESHPHISDMTSEKPQRTVLTKTEPEVHNAET